MKLWLLIMFCAAMATVLASASAFSDGEPVAPHLQVRHFSGILVSPDGKPATDAVITLYFVNHDNRQLVSTRQIDVDSNGHYSGDATTDRSSDEAPLLVARSSSGVALLPAEGDATAPTVLQPFTSIRIRLIDESGNPLAGVTISPRYFDTQSYGVVITTFWWKSMDERWTVTTDSSGVAEIDDLPQNYSVLFRVDGDDYVEPDPNGDRVLLAGSAITPDQTLKIATGSTISGSVAYGPTGLPAGGIHISAQGSSGVAAHQFYARTAPTGNFKFTNVFPGDYAIEFDGDANHSTNDWTSVAKIVTVKAGQDLDGVKIALIKGALLTGTVMNKKTGKPAANLGISYSGPEQPSDYDAGWSSGTDDNGRYNIRVAPGLQTMTLMRISNGGEYPLTDNKPLTVMVNDGKSNVFNFSVVDSGTPSQVGGIVYGVDGKPVSGAKVVGVDPPFGNTVVVSDAAGRFDFASPGLSTNAVVYAVDGRCVSAHAVPAEGSQDLVLRIEPNVGTSISGAVNDNRGRPIRGALVALEPNDPLSDQTVTDASGGFLFPQLYGEGSYDVFVTCPGYGGGSSNGPLKAIRGRSIHLPPIVLGVADSFVSGKVVDPSGAPEVGATVFAVGNENDRTTTDSSGRFRIDGIPEVNGMISVQAKDRRQMNAVEPVNSSNNVITVMTQPEQLAVEQKHLAMFDADPTNHGDGTPALRLLRVAKRKARVENKAIFLDFHASRCGPCFYLHKFLEDVNAKPVFGKYFVVQAIDVSEFGKTKPWENPGGVALYCRYCPNYEGVPFEVLLNRSGRMVSNIPGMPSTCEDIISFLARLKACAPAMTKHDMAALRTSFNRIMKPLN